MQGDRKTCETCGKPARVVVHDFRTVEESGGLVDPRRPRWIDFELDGVHWFCPDHVRPGRTAGRET